VKNLLLVLSVIAFSGCGFFQKINRSEKPEINKDYVFSYVDNLQDKKISILFESHSSSSLCMTNSTWPSNQGQLDGAARRVFIFVRDNKYPFKNYELNYCPFRECAIKVEKDEKIRAEIFYKDFELPEDLYSETKKLVLDVKPFWCDQGKWMD
jgi:hypothetical protein